MISKDGKPLGKVSLDQALFLAYDKGLDLIELNGSITPPVCKLMDYGKFLYEKSKQVQKQKAKQKTTEIKEIKLGINIGEHDLEVKENRAKEFFQNGHKVKLFIILKGRQNMFKNKVQEIFERFKNDTNAEFDQLPNQQGNRFYSIIKKK